MQKLIIQETDETPAVIFDTDSNELEIKGACYPENTIAFFEPIYEWFNDFAEKNPNKSAHLKINLVYFNTASSKCLLDLFELLDDKLGDSIKINWVYIEGDEDMKSAGEDYEKIVNVPFNIVEVEDDDAEDDNDFF